ncbi:helix-turn-helix domain-containing protein [Nocardioides salarius]
MTTAQSEAISIAVEVGANIHQQMWRRKINQTQLGAAIGVSQSTAGKKVRGEVPITVVELMQIARLLGVEPGDLVKLPRLDSNQQPSD